MLVTKRVQDIKVGEMYLAYSAKSKMLSSNGKRGVLVIANDVGDNSVKVFIPKFNREMRITRLDNRDDAWVVPASGKGLTFDCIKTERVEEWPKLHPRQMVKGQEITSVSEYEGKHFIITKGDKEFPFLYLPEWVERSDDTPIIRWQKEAEEKAKAMEAARKAMEAELEARKGEAVQLMRGKMDGGKVTQLSYLLPYYDKIAASDWHNYGDTASYCRIFLEDEAAMFTPNIAIEWCSNRACHAQMNGGPRKLKDINDELVTWQGGYCLAIWTDHDNEQCDGHGIPKEDQLLWIDYIINRSGFAKLHLIKDPEVVYEKGYLVDADYPSRLVMAATACTRQIWEYRNKGKGFASLVKNGCNEHVAWYAAQCCGGKTNGTYTFNVPYAGHTFMDQRLDDDAILNFLRGEPKKKYKSYTKEWAYGGTDNQWGRTMEGELYYALMNKTGGHKVKDPKNPFAKPSLPSNEAMANIVNQAGMDFFKRMGVDPVTLKGL